MNDKINPVCPQCGEEEAIDANTWEAWCDSCGWWTTEEDQYAKIRAMVLARREEVGGFFDEMLKRGNR